MKRVAMQEAYVLHRRSYRETSLLVELFSLEYGRLSVLAKGARQAKSVSRSYLQPFQALTVSWVGSGELMTLTQVDPVYHGNTMLNGDALAAGFYLNELLVSLLEKWDPHPNLFHIYANTLKHLAENELDEKVLRNFEIRLLEELGYGLLPKAHEHMPMKIIADNYYRLMPEHGFQVSDNQHEGANIFSGQNLLDIAAENWRDETTLYAAKRMTRLMLASLLGNKKIYSRYLFVPRVEELSENE